jgi:hypothetical protein
LVYAILEYGYRLADISWDRRLESDCIVRRNCKLQHSIDIEVASAIAYV